MAEIILLYIYKQKGTQNTYLNFCEAYDCSLKLFFSETLNIQIIHVSLSVSNYTKKIQSFSLEVKLALE